MEIKLNIINSIPKNNKVKSAFDGVWMPITFASASNISGHIAIVNNSMSKNIQSTAYLIQLHVFSHIQYNQQERG